ncbi:hypothetical protein, partial [Vibrio anguillarum]|uniref:hypothetical protein n=1 Tax=Vibrio anguillarum TaxID=55601 RepID=UPI001BE3F619
TSVWCRRTQFGVSQRCRNVVKTKTLKMTGKNYQQKGRANPVSYTQIPKPLLGDFFELILCFMI